MTARELLALGLVALCAAGGTCRPLGADLRGDELLVAVQKVGGGTGVPGIYAVSPEGVTQRVIAYGQRPCWAPDRRHFAFELAGRLCLADLAQHLTQELADARFALEPFVLPEPVRSPSLFLDRAGTGLVGWQALQGGSAVTAALQPWRLGLDGHEAAKRLLPDEVSDVGRVSTSADGSVMAYERYRRVLGIGALDRTVVLRRPGLPAATWSVPSYSAGAWLNPLVSPDGRWLLLDWLASDATRQTLLAPVDGNSPPARAKLPHAECNWSMGVAWSPDGQRILVTEAARQGTGYGYLQLLSVGQDGTAVQPLRVGVTKHPHRACWSPDSRRIAVLQSQRAEISPDDEVDLTIWDARRGDRTVAFDGDLRPVELAW